MSISVVKNSVVAAGSQQIGLSSLFSETAASGNPTYLIVSGLDVDEYTAGYNTATMGKLSGNGASQGFTNFGGSGSGDYTIDAVFTYQASTGRYYSATYGYFDQMTYTTSANPNDNVSLSVYTTNSASLASSDAANPYTLTTSPHSFNYVGSVSVVTQPSFVGPVPAQATPNSVCSTALTFVGKAWNQDGCWVLASTISAEAGASLPATSSLSGIASTGNGEWVVAYDGPVTASSNWQSLVHAGEMVDFIPAGSGSGHITTCVSGAGSSAMLVDNITYENAHGGITNAANDGSAADVIVAAPHAASQEFTGASASSVVIYELDAPVVTDTVATVGVAKGGTQALAPLFSVSNPVASQAITEYQLYDTASADIFSVSGAAEAAHSATTALTVASLGGVSLVAGASAGSDTIEVRAYNGSYWGDWESLTVAVGGTTAPVPSTPSTPSTPTTNPSSGGGSGHLHHHDTLDPNRWWRNAPVSMFNA